MDDSCTIKLNGLKAVLLGMGALCLFGFFFVGLMISFNLIPAWPAPPHARLGPVVGGLILTGPLALSGVRLLVCFVTGRPAFTAKNGKIQDNVLAKSYDFKDVVIVEPSKGAAILIRLKPNIKAYALALWCSEPKWVIAERLNAIVQASRSATSG